jgi:hypothetical protein
MTTPSTSTELTIIPGIEANKLALITPESALAVKNAYLPHFEAFLALEKQAAEIAVNSPKLARVMRLDLRKVRVAAEKARKELGVEAKNYKEAVDQVYNILEDRLKPVEQRMESIEKAEEIAAKERADALKAARIAELTPFALVTGTQIEFYDLANMPEAQYVSLRDSTKAAAEAKQLAIKQAEEARVAAEAAKEAERVRLAEENRKLAAEAAERQKALDAERAKVEEERKKAAAEAERLRKESEAKLAAERAAKEAEIAAERRIAAEKEAKARAEREAAEKAAQAKRNEEAKKAAAEQAAKDAAAKAERDRLAKEAEKAREQAQKLADAEAARKVEQKRLLDEAEAKIQAASKAPDKTKLATFAKAIRALPLPTLSSPTGKALAEKIASQSAKFAQWVEAEAAKL